MPALSLFGLLQRVLELVISPAALVENFFNLKIALVEGNIRWLLRFA